MRLLIQGVMQGSCLAGTVPRLPLVADAADQQVR